MKIQTTTNQDFVKTLAGYKSLIDSNINDYVKLQKKNVLNNYGENSAQAMDAYYDILQRGGKRIRGALAIVGYKLVGGKDMAMIVEAARILEMIHAYILIIDDINDKSRLRRGAATAHYMLADKHRDSSYFGDSAHFGESIAINAALVGCHNAQAELSLFDLPDNIKVKALGVVNYSMGVTGHGQINDMYNEVVSDVRLELVNKVLDWKTAHYTFLNPLTFGMILAGASCADTDAIAGYSMNAGRVFQITDDILGTFSESDNSGKSPLDDTREGKRTVLSLSAIEQASKADKYFLLQQLGNQDLTRSNFEQVKKIYQETGALKQSQLLVSGYATTAQAELRSAADTRGWAVDDVEFLSDLIEYLKTRTA
jgi:geranylgeranyl diphosphate synthase, type I